MKNAPPRPWASLQKAVKKAGLNYTKLAELAGISRQYVSFFANGIRHPSAGHVKILAEALGVPVEELAVDVALATSPQEILDEIDSLVTVLSDRVATANKTIETIKAQRAHLEQLVQVPA